MWRSVLAVSAMLAVIGVAAGQEKTPDPEQEAKAAQKAWEKYLEKYPTDVPDVVAKPAAEVPLTTPPNPLNHSPLTKTEKLAMSTLSERDRQIDLINTRIRAGQFSGNSAYQQLIEANADRYATVRELCTDPNRLLVWAKHHLYTIRKAEEFSLPLTERGVFNQDTMAHLRVARYRAEAEVLKLQEQIESNVGKKRPTESTTTVPTASPIVACPTAVCSVPVFANVPNCGPRRILARPLFGLQR